MLQSDASQEAMAHPNSQPDRVVAVPNAVNIGRKGQGYV
jgi:hypothetical protein